MNMFSLNLSAFQIRALAAVD